MGYPNEGISKLTRFLSKGGIYNQKISKKSSTQQFNSLNNHKIDPNISLNRKRMHENSNDLQRSPNIGKMNKIESISHESTSNQSLEENPHDLHRSHVSMGKSMLASSDPGIRNHAQCPRHPVCDRHPGHRGMCRIKKTGHVRKNNNKKQIIQLNPPRNFKKKKIPKPTKKEQVEVVDDELMDPKQFWIDMEEYLCPLSQSSIDVMEKVRSEMSSTVLPNHSYMERNSIDSQDIFVSMREEGCLNIEPSVNSVRRGRFYDEVWEEEKFLSSIDNDQSLSSSESQLKLLRDFSDLTYGFNDDEYINYLDRAYHALSTSSQNINRYSKMLIVNSGIDTKSMSLQDNSKIDPPPVPVLTTHPASWGMTSRISSVCMLNIKSLHPAAIESTLIPRWKQEIQLEKSGNNKLGDYDCIIEEDQIYHEINHIASYLTPLCASLWKKVKYMHDMAKSEIEVSGLLEHEAKLSLLLERIYQVFYPDPDPKAPRYLKCRSSVDEILNYVTREASAQTATVIKQATKYSMSLKVGDAIDALDKNGTWQAAFVIDLFREGCEVVRYLKVHFIKWGDHSDEWVSTFSGRILPRGMCVPLENKPKTIEEKKSISSDENT